MNIEPSEIEDGIHGSVGPLLAELGRSKLLLVDTDEHGRFTLSLETASLPVAGEVELGSFWMLPGNARKPRFVRIGGTTLELDQAGARKS